VLSLELARLAAICFAVAIDSFPTVLRLFFLLRPFSDLRFAGFKWLRSGRFSREEKEQEYCSERTGISSQMERY
jgi:hypothetical protein